MIFSCIIPASPNDCKSIKLKELIHSIRSQDFKQDEIEILVVTNGEILRADIVRTDVTFIWAESDSESAKAIGIKHAKGEICVMLCADNYFTDSHLFSQVFDYFLEADSVYERHYAYVPHDNSLNRYFSLIGNNDPIPFYLGKCDREPWVDGLYKTRGIPSYGCNGFFVKRDRFKDTNLDDYYPMDAHVDMIEKGLTYAVLEQGTVWHRTSDTLISFLKKRYKYARDLYSDRNNRRWKMLGTKDDYWRLCLFILSTITVIPAVLVSVRGYLKIRDKAWFWHFPVCLGFLITYGVLACRNMLRLLSSSQRLSVKDLLRNALSPSTVKPLKTTR